MRLRREQADEQVCTVAVRMPVALRDRLDRERHRRVVGRNPVIAAIEAWLDVAEREPAEGHVWRHDGADHAGPAVIEADPALRDTAT